MKRCLLLSAVVLAGFCLASPRPAAAGEIGWLESFSLATDRTVPLKQLIPGTEDFYYYHCLHYQNTEQWAKVDELLKAWAARYNWTARAVEIQNRQALLTYKTNPDATLALLQNRLNLTFAHQREQLNQKPNLPTKLDLATIARERLSKLAYDNNPNSLNGFEDAAFDWLITAELNGYQRRHLLGRLKRPDYPTLVRLIQADLNFENSGGFGHIPIHRMLLRAQLDELAKLRPALKNDSNYVHTYIARLHPTNDTNWRQDNAALAAYLDRLWAFVEPLDPAHNSLKAHVLYHRLVLDRQLGKYDPAKFLAYLKLPKHVPYVSPKYMEAEIRRQYPSNLQQDFSSVTLLPPVGNDEPLVRSYLQQLLLEADDTKEYEPYIESGYLTRVFAETKIVNGLGDAEKWYSLLPPADYQALKERIDLDFAFTNKNDVAPEDAVGLDLYVKNVETLIVKVFEINTQNYYRQNLKEVGPDVNLDGLVANEEKTYKYSEPPLRRMKRHFEFPSLDKRGVYVIDFIGNGKASRAVIRKGRLRYIVRTGVAGQVFTVLNEKNEPVEDAAVWLAGTLYPADKDGAVAVPFTARPGRTPVVLSSGTFSSLDSFQQQSEQYSLRAAFYVDREELIARRKAQVVIRPRVSIGGTAVTPQALEDVRLVITSVDLDGVVTTKEVPDVKVFQDRETVHEFQVPQRLATINFRLKAKVQQQTTGQKIDLAADRTFALNEIDRTDKIQDLHFARIGGDYVIDALGKSGEVKANRPLQIVLKLRDYTAPVHVSLQTDGKGRTVLGSLPGVVNVTATSPDGVTHNWPVRHDEHTYSDAVHAKAGETIQVPYMGTAAKPDRAELSLLELRGENFAIDRFENLSIKNGLLQIDKLPPGDYSLLLKPTNTQMRLRVTEGVLRKGYALGSFRKLEVRNARPLQVEKVELTEKTVRVQLQNATPLARVHVFATRFEPAYSAYANLSPIRTAEPHYLTTPKVESQYVAGRNIGDEYRYIIDRKFTRKFPGNMLERPSLLLNPWAIRSTETGEQLAQAGEDFRGEAPKPDSMVGAYGGKATPQGGVQADYSDLDFLANSAMVVGNMVADKNGVVEVDRKHLGPYQELVVVAVDPHNTASRTIPLTEAKPEYLDLRLVKGLDPTKHFTQQQRISIVPAGEKLVIPDIVSTRFEYYDSIPRVYGLYAALNQDPKLVEFNFITTWPSLKIEEKRTLYSKYASHELHLFLHQKDPDFFKSVVRPYLANKKEKKFIDHWLLEEDLSDWLKPWNFEQLNTAERALLGHRINEEQANTARLIREQFDLLPPDQERLNRLFQTALKSASLSTGDALGLNETLEKARQAAPKLPAPADPASAPGASAPREEPASDAPARTPAGEAKPAAPPPVNAGAKADEKAKAGGFGNFRGGKDPAKKMRADGKELKDSEGEEARFNDLGDMDSSAVLEDDRKYMPGLKQYYRKLDKTMEWVESQYYKLPIEQQNAGLITASAFFRDFSAHQGGAPFLSTNLADATRNFPESLIALALTDLPFTAKEHKTVFDGTQMTLTAGGPMIVYHEEIQPASKVAENTPILVSENFFRHGERYRQEGPEQVDRFVTEEFLVDTVYGCHIVVTNPSSSKKKVDVLLQVPTGAVPVANGQYTRSVRIDLAPYHTTTLEYFFYFPAAGKFPHYPVQVAANNEMLAFAKPFSFNVVNELTKIDKDSWEYVSQHGTGDDVIAFLKRENVLRVNLDRIAWRMHDKAFFEQTLALLGGRHIYQHTLWSYGVKHNDPAAIRQFLQFANEFVAQCGDWIDSPLLVIDPIARRTYEHMDYKPLVNPRVGRLGRNREILNDRFLTQYQRLLKILSYRRQPSNTENLATTYYLVLQDRVDEALEFFDRVNAQQLETKLQYDYCAAYLHFSKGEPKLARQIAAKYDKHPVDRWRNVFANVVNQAEEIETPDVKVVDNEDRTQVQTAAAAKTVSHEFTIEGRTVKLNYQALKQVQVNYYLMDIELLFSRNPFVQGDARQFSHIVPNHTTVLELPAKGDQLEFKLPEKLAGSNLLVEIVGGGETKSQAYFSNALQVQVVENYGQVRVTTGKDQPLPKTYVKAYARMKDGSVRFYKDGYTDLRGRFDYSSLNTNELEIVDKFSLLVLHDVHGALVKEAKPPKQ